MQLTEIFLRKILLSWFFGVFGAGIFVSSQVLSETYKSIVVPVEPLRILIINIERYVAAQGDGLITVILSKVPDPTITEEDIRALTINMTPQPAAQRLVQQVITLNRNDILCLRTNADSVLNSIPASGEVDFNSLLEDKCN